MIEVRLAGIELLGRHGVTEEERSRQQRFVFDVSLVLASDEAATSDRLEDTVDYRDVLACAREVCERGEYRLLEALAGALVQELRRRFRPQSLTVAVEKPEVELGGSAPRVTVAWP